MQTIRPLSLQNPDVRKPDISLNLSGVLDAVQGDGRLSRESVETLSLKTRTKDQLEWHPIELIAEEQPSDAANPGRLLDLETLTLWMCEHFSQPYKRIDPLKIDSTAVTRVMSSEFARRHQILVVDVADEAVLIQSSRPTVYGWEGTIEQSQPAYQGRQ